jgi:hypothetical protein
MYIAVILAACECFDNDYDKSVQIVRHATSPSCAEKPQSAAEQVRGPLWLSGDGNISAVSQAETRYATQLPVK